MSAAQSSLADPWPERDVPACRRCVDHRTIDRSVAMIQACVQSVRLGDDQACDTTRYHSPRHMTGVGQNRSMADEAAPIDRSCGSRVTTLTGHALSEGGKYSNRSGTLAGLGRYVDRG